MAIIRACLVRPLLRAVTLLSFSYTILLISSHASAFVAADIQAYLKDMSRLSLGERIALWAEKFVETPYDPDPDGEYVTKKVIIADERVDCMYLSFRALELALSQKPEDAVAIALDKRFRGRGVLDGDVVTNYEDRFEYGEDMIDSGKWGKEITGEIGAVTNVRGARGREKVEMLSKEEVLSLLKEPKNAAGFRSGDIVFFIKSPEKRVMEEIVGHLGIIKKEQTGLYLIHASGRKRKGGIVKKVFLYDYISSMPFIGMRVSRFD
ncbi:MAG TPA: hypothetical protein VFG09_04640 [Thermodesulfovibrionales bacterium]|nr:hypothetical protein [Thermodesulfovibrionales bacterium]